jgi:hypothetical protein
MQTYGKFSPTSCDTAGLGCEDQQDWLVAPVGLNRDSDALGRSNWRVVVKDIQSHDNGDQDDTAVHRFGHWACGWFELLLVRPDTAAAKCAEGWEGALADYPVADDEDLSLEEDEEAQVVWSECMTQSERLCYIRDHRSEFEFHSFTDMLGCARGNYFCGNASELIFP